MANSSRVWFVTGASAGLGRAVIEYVLEQGDKVVATCRKPEALSALASQYPASQLIVAKLDVTSSSEIAAAFTRAIEAFGRVDIVYNNAGYPIVSEIEGTPDEVARAQFDVNFWGATNVSREAVRVFRDVNKPSGGRLLQASSVAGIEGYPGFGFYSASKFALEGLNDALAKELHPSWNIKVHLLEFGVFKTRVLTPESLVVVPEHPAYNLPDSVTKLTRVYAESSPPGNDAGKAAREIYKIVGDDTIGLRIPLGLDALEFVKQRGEALMKVVEETKKWSVDLK